MWPRRALLSAPVTAEIAEIGSNNSTFASGVAAGESGPGTNRSTDALISHRWTLAVGVGPEKASGTRQRTG